MLRDNRSMRSRRCRQLKRSERALKLSFLRSSSEEAVRSEWQPVRRRCRMEQYVHDDNFLIGLKADETPFETSIKCYISQSSVCDGGKGNTWKRNSAGAGRL